MAKTVSPTKTPWCVPMYNPRRYQWDPVQCSRDTLHWTPHRVKHANKVYLIRKRWWGRLPEEGVVLNADLPQLLCSSVVWELKPNGAFKLFILDERYRERERGSERETEREMNRCNLPAQENEGPTAACVLSCRALVCLSCLRTW